MSHIHSLPASGPRARGRTRTTVAALLSGALVTAAALVAAPGAEAADSSQTIQFESVAAENGTFDANPDLIAGTDYQNGDNGPGPGVGNNVLKTENDMGNRALAGVTTGAWVRYPDVDLGSNHAVALSVSYDAPTGRVVSPQLVVHVDSATAAPLVTANLTNTGSGWNEFYTTTTVDLPPTLTGKHDLYVEFLSTPDSDHPYVGNFDYFTLYYTIDTAGLNDAVSNAQTLTAHPEWYPTATYQVFSSALAAAQQVAADADATFTEVETAKSDLQTAVGGLRWIIVDDLNAKLTQAGQARQQDYTAASWATLQQAVSAARTLNESSSSHADYEQALSDLTAAYDGLVAMKSSQTAINGAPATVDEGKDLTFTVAVSEGATGSVDIVEGATTLTAVALGPDSTAQVTLSGLALGTHTIEARYSGDGAYLPSASEPVSVEVVEVTTPPVDQLAVTAPTVSARTQVFGATNGRVTLTSTVSGATAGTVTFRSGGTTLGSAAITQQGAVYRATLTVLATQAVGTYGGLTATVRADDGRTAVSTASAASFSVVKAKIQKLKVKTPKKAKKHHAVKVRVKASKTLTNGAKAKGKVWVYVGKKAVKHLSVAKIAKKGKVKLAKKLVKGKKIKVRVAFVPAKSLVSGVETTTVTSKIKVKK